MYDEERDVEYPAWKAKNDDAMSSRALDTNALPVIYSMKVTQAKVNHEIAMGLRTDFENGKIKLLVDEMSARDYLTDQKNFANLEPEEQAELITPYVQTTALINEMVNLEYTIRGGNVVVHTVRGGRKDRYSSLGYANYYARIIEDEMARDANQVDAENDDELIMF